MFENIPPAVITAAIGGLAGFAAGLVSPVFKLVESRFAKADAEQERRRAQIATWRQMLLDIRHQATDDQGNWYMDVSQHTQLHPDYLALRPHLSSEARRKAESEHSGRTLTVGSALGTQLECLNEEINRLELLWGLRR